MGERILIRRFQTHTSFPQPADQHVPESRCGCEYASALLSSRKLGCVQRQAQRRLAEKFHGRAIARITFVGNGSVNFASVSGNSYQMAAEEAVVHGLLRWAMARLGCKRLHQSPRKRGSQPSLQQSEP